MNGKKVVALLMSIMMLSLFTVSAFAASDETAIEPRGRSSKFKANVDMNLIPVNSDGYLLTAPDKVSNTRCYLQPAKSAETQKWKFVPNEVGQYDVYLSSSLENGKTHVALNIAGNNGALLYTVRTGSNSNAKDRSVHVVDEGSLGFLKGTQYGLVLHAHNPILALARSSGHGDGYNAYWTKPSTTSQTFPEQLWKLLAA